MWAKRTYFVNKVRRLFEGGAMLIILLSLAALKRVNTVMRISVVAKQFYSWRGGGLIFLYHNIFKKMLATGRNKLLAHLTQPYRLSLMFPHLFSLNLPNFEIAFSKILF
jgi:hypothetical protein